jgi:uncharacterized protein YeaO (DUF488 family)
MLKVKRIYEAPEPSDGFRILVDRLWPRGITKEKAALDLWLKDIAPSNALRQWYQHDPEKWPEFQHRYAVELRDKQQTLDLIRDQAKTETVSLLFGSKEMERNNATALLAILNTLKTA